jgi:hypothetical protein
LFAQALDSQAKRSPKRKSQQVYRWQFFGYCLHNLSILKLKDHPSVNMSKFTGGKDLKQNSS